MDALPDSPPENMRSLLGYLSQGLVGHERLIERLMISLLTGGHLLLEGPPGLAKTRAVKWLSNAVEGSFARIQCTPDLMPADLTGTPVFRPQTGTFEFVPGPVFHNLVLVDEINRAPPKVQSALLEAMAEGQVTAGNQTHALPDPFLVVATQNPIEHDGTFPLPEAQLDRFLLYVNLELPDAKTERQILDLVEAEAAQPPVAAAQMPLAALQEARRQAMAVHLSPELRDYIVRLVTATRQGNLSAEIEHAVSPRGSLALASASKARAYLRGRDYALPEDVADLAGDTMAHRMVLSWRAVAEGRSQRDVVATILGAVEAL
ncbi:AAA family ATPase [Primorskyibacter flagellatus]|uniref:AAA family ATPase n=1 Tax=Primorskyibacter flagellatus TaxID=1387277 RepID=UPI003A9167A1